MWKDQGALTLTGSQVLRKLEEEGSEFEPRDVYKVLKEVAIEGVDVVFDPSGFGFYRLAGYEEPVYAAVENPSHRPSLRLR